MSTAWGTHRPTEQWYAPGYHWLWPGFIPNVPPGVTTSAFVVQQWPGQVGAAALRPAPALPVAAPPQSGSVFTRQQQPDHPSEPFTTWALSGVHPQEQLWGLQVSTMQEQPAHPGPFVRPAYQGPNVAPPPQVGSVLTRQEQVYYLPSFTWLAHQGPNTRPPVTDTTIGRQEQPFHPLPYTQTAHQGPNVAYPPQVGAIKTTQEQPFHPLPAVFPGAPPVAPQFGTHSVGGQEQPPWQAALTFPGPPGPNVAGSGEPSPVRTVQEQPYHPGPYVLAGKQGPNVAAPPQVGAVRNVQEQPFHPLPAALAGVQGPNVGPPVRAIALTSQQQPDHPLPFVRTSLPGAPVLPAITRETLTRQEQPDHPLPRTLIAYQGPNVAAPPQVGSVRITQEQPWHPLPLVQRSIGYQGVIVAPLVAEGIFVRQQWPGQVGTLPQTRMITAPTPGPTFGTTAFARQQEIPTSHPTGFSWYPPDFCPATGPWDDIFNCAFGDGSIAGRPWINTSQPQEQPFHPGPFVRIGRVINAEPIPPLIKGTRITTSQEQPTHPLPWAKMGAQPTNPAVHPQLLGSATANTQEQPYHPTPWSRLGVNPTNPAVHPIIQSGVLLRQEMPLAHPFARQISWVTGSNVATAETGMVFVRQQWPGQVGAKPEGPYLGVAQAYPAVIAGVSTTQEQPAHPLPFVRSQPPTNRPAGPPIRNTAITTQQPPWHPLPFTGSRQPTNPIAHPIIASGIITRQEQPWRVGPGHLPSLEAPQGAVQPLQGAITLGLPQSPYGHPFARQLGWVTGPNAVPPESGSVFTRQQWPGQVGSRGSLDVQAVTTPPSVEAQAIFVRQEWPGQVGNRPTEQVMPSFTVIHPLQGAYLRTIQQQPDHPLPTVHPSLQARNVAAPPQIGAVRTLQEQPFHPGPFFVGARPITPPSHAVLDGSSLFVPPQTPDHPAPRVWASCQGPNVRPPVSDRIATTQEQPYHPGPALWHGTEPVYGVLRGAIVFTQQQLPDHPIPRTWAAHQGPNTRPPVTDWVRTVQQQPDHPAPWSRIGVPPYGFVSIPIAAVAVHWNAKPLTVSQENTVTIAQTSWEWNHEALTVQVENTVPIQPVIWHWVGRLFEGYSPTPPGEGRCNVVKGVVQGVVRSVVKSVLPD